MTSAEFIRKWQAGTLKERSAVQKHFIDLCRLLGIPPPAEADPYGEWFTFEKGARETVGGAGWVDVWQRHCFAWEYKGKHKSLVEALRQRLYKNSPLPVGEGLGVRALFSMG